RFTFDPGNDYSPSWSPDGRRVTFLSTRDGGGALYWKLSNGTGKEELLTKHGGTADWSPDGRFLIYSARDPSTKSDLWVMPVDGDRKPTPYIKTEFDEGQG